jgi:hypothetical protein
MCKPCVCHGFPISGPGPRRCHLLPTNVLDRNRLGTATDNITKVALHMK